MQGVKLAVVQVHRGALVGLPRVSIISKLPSLSPRNSMRPSKVQSKAENSVSSRANSSSNSPRWGSMRRTTPSYADVCSFPVAHLLRVVHYRPCAAQALTQ